MLSKVTNPLNHVDFSKMLAQTEFAINNNAHCSAKQPPSKLLFRVDQLGVVTWSRFEQRHLNVL